MTRNKGRFRPLRVQALNIVGDLGKSLYARPLTAPANFSDWLGDALARLERFPE